MGWEQPRSPGELLAPARLGSTGAGVLVLDFVLVEGMCLSAGACGLVGPEHLGRTPSSGARRKGPPRRMKHGGGDWERERVAEVHCR